MNLATRCASIRLLLTDVDGVLTPGTVELNDRGEHAMTFNIRDGLGIKLWQRAGGQVGIVTGRKTEVVARRAADLGIDPLRQGVGDKLPVIEEICRELQLAPEQVAYVGDDLPDIGPIRFAGLGVAVADAAIEVQQAADYRTSIRGGGGAVREVIELILRNTNRWEETIAHYAA